METPEWDIFKRLEELEPEIEKLRPEVDTASKVGTVGLLLFFMYVAVERPDSARKFKDIAVSMLKGVGLSAGDVELLEGSMLTVCDLIEGKR